MEIVARGNRSTIEGEMKSGVVFLLSGLGSMLMAAERPNIVFLLTDDQAVDTLGCYGIREALEKQGVAGNTVVVFTSDNGFLNGAHGDGSKVFAIGEDPMEMTNQIESVSYEEALKRMEKLYDGAVKKWREEAVPHHGYAPYGTVFDRSVAWEKKAEVRGGK